MSDSKIFATRRAALLKALSPDSVAIVAASPEILRNADSAYYYRQNSDFFYLTGLEEPDAVAFFIPKGKDGEFIIFNRPHDTKKEQWDGVRLGQEGACKQLGADAAYPIHELHKRAVQLLQGRKQVCYLLTHQKHVHQWVQQWLQAIKEQPRAGKSAPTACIELAELLHEQRLVKQKDEIDLMRKAADISVQAHCRAISACQPDMYEYELEAELMYEFYRHGCRAPAYTPIVASGANACTLHYVTNQDQMRDGDLVLIDAAGEYQYYAADITRTFPVGTQFSAEQQAIYEIVLAAQTAAIDAVKPGLQTQMLQETVVRLISQGLLDLGLLKGSLDTIIEKKAYQDFYMHNVSHWLGMDVHDVGAYKRDGEWRELKTGMTLTVEPGIYIAPHLKVDAKWHGIGVRIEDDVLVTKTGSDVLSAAVPKTIPELLALRRGA